MLVSRGSVFARVKERRERREGVPRRMKEIEMLVAVIAFWIAVGSAIGIE